MSPWEKLLERPQSGGHFVQMYNEGEDSLANTVALYLWEGLRRGDGVLVVATPGHWELFWKQLNRLGADISSTLTNRQLVWLDAQATLNQFMVHGQPDWRRFEAVVNAAMRQVLPSTKDAGLRAYGEMVGILWKAKQFVAAVRLEQLWNKLLEQSSFSLYCAYAIDIFGKDFQTGALDSILCTHTHMVPAQPNGKLDAALKHAIHEVLGGSADDLKSLVQSNRRPSWPVMPNAESTILWLRKNLPAEAEEILTRAASHYRLHPAIAAAKVAAEA